MLLLMAVAVGSSGKGVVTRITGPGGHDADKLSVGGGGSSAPVAVSPD